MLRRVIGRDGVRLAYYEYGTSQVSTMPLSNDSSISKPAKYNILFSHGTGFHGRVFDSTINYLGVENYNCFSIDHRGHGQSGWNTTIPLHWDSFADDLLDVSHACCGTEKIIGVGHSMGSAALLMAALREPDKFSCLILYEPIIFPLEMRLLFSLFKESPLAKLARKRRNVFKSHEEAIANFSKKPPMNTFDKQVLNDFVTYGLASQLQLDVLEKAILKEEDIDVVSTEQQIISETTTSGGDDEQDPVYLRCEREREASVYNTGHHHTTWNDLHKLAVPTVVLAGKYDIKQPSFWAQRLANRIPGSEFIRWDKYSHFGPLENPKGLSDCIEKVICEKLVESQAAGDVVKSSSL
jgi:pimeloyl-ACP methyl ester carboxylesterase